MRKVKGITPLIASVFLIVLVITLAGIIMTWLTTVVKDTQATVGERSGESIECSNADITIDQVFVTDGSARAIVRNSGFVDNLSLPTAQLINYDGSTFVAENVPVENFYKGDIVTLEFHGAGINCALFSKIMVTTSCAAVSAQFTGAPECV